MIKNIAFCLLFSFSVITLAKAEDLITKDVVEQRQFWHTEAECPLKLVYGERFDYKIKISFKYGKVYRNNEPWKSAAYYFPVSRCSNIDKNSFPETLYVVSPTGDFYVANICSQPSRKLIYPPTTELKKCDVSNGKDITVVHSTIIGNYKDRQKRQVVGKVAGAGTIYINEDAKVTAITNCSGHYQPNREMFDQTISLLEKQGVLAGPNPKGSFLIENYNYCGLRDQQCMKAVFKKDNVTDKIGSCYFKGDI